MVTIPTTFPELAVVPISYNYTDIIDGTGVAIFYGLLGVDSAGTNRILHQTQLFSEVIETLASTTSTNFATMFEQTFSLTAFNISRTVKGTAIFQAGILYKNPGGGENIVMKYTATLIKNNAAGDTTIGTNVSDEKLIDGTDRIITALKIALTETHFGIGETLKLTVKIEGKVNSGTGTIVIGHDPQNRDGTNIIPSTDDIISRMEIHVPFRIDT